MVKPEKGRLFCVHESWEAKVVYDFMEAITTRAILEIQNNMAKNNNIKI